VGWLQREAWQSHKWSGLGRPVLLHLTFDLLRAHEEASAALAPAQTLNIGRDTQITLVPLVVHGQFLTNCDLSLREQANPVYDLAVILT